MLCAKLLSHVQLFATLWTVAYQAPLSMGFSRQESWSGLPCPPWGDLPDPGIEPASLTSVTLEGRFFTTEPPGKPSFFHSENWNLSAIACTVLIIIFTCEDDIIKLKEILALEDNFYLCFLPLFVKYENIHTYHPPQIIIKQTPKRPACSLRNRTCRSSDFIFLESKITADCDCSHERKAMTKLDSILKSRDIA